MIRLTKLTDYGIVLMSHLAAEPTELMTASSLSQATQLPLPTVSKILKACPERGFWSRTAASTVAMVWSGARKTSRWRM